MSYRRIDSELLIEVSSKIRYALERQSPLQCRQVRCQLCSEGNCVPSPLMKMSTHSMSRAFVLGLILGCLSFTSVSAQEWAEKMFNKREHDFGTVARGADTVYKFEVTNLYKQEMKITGVRSSCGCTSPTVENGTIKTYEKAYIVAKFNTRTFVGMHGATLTVTFAPPYSAEVQVRVHGNIRSDVVFSPGSIAFGNVDEGAPQEQTVVVNYAGRQNWSIVDVTNDNDQFEVELNEISRSAGKVSYGLLVRLKENAPVGYLRDQLTVVTNDQRADSQRIPLFIEGRIIPEISVTPESLVLGDVTPGEPITRKIVVRGKKPFKILDVNCGDDCFEFKTDEESKELHLVELTYVPTETPGPVKVPVQITTDRPNRNASFMVTATVTAPAQAPATEAQADTSGQTGISVEAAKVADSAGTR